MESLLAAIDHPRADDIRTLSGALMREFPDLTDEIKWNAPSYAINSVNIVTLRILPPPNFQVILHVGSRKPVDKPDLRFEIDGLRHAWPDRARGVLHIDQAADIPLAVDAVRRWRDTLAGNGLF